MATEAYPTENSMPKEAYSAESHVLGAFCAWCRIHAVPFYGEQRLCIDVFMARILEWRHQA